MGRLRGLLLSLVLSACQAAPAEEGEELGDRCDARQDGVFCTSRGALTCKDNDVVASVSCSSTDAATCIEGIGCASCRPYAWDCVGNALHRCAPDGQELREVEVCEDGLLCSETGCRDLCREAAESLSYLGCEYWPVFTRNTQLDPLFKPAVVVGNPNLVDAQIEVRRGGVRIVQTTVPRQSSDAIELEFDRELKGPRPEEMLLLGGPKTVLVEDAAYQIISSVPVTVHQFNPLLFETDAGDCGDPDLDRDDPNTPVDERTDGKCNSYTNDASLLLPAHALRNDYLVSTRGTFSVRSASASELFGLGGFVAITSVAPEPVDVAITLSSYTEPSEDGVFPAYAPSDAFTVRLNQGDVFQLLGAAGPTTCPTEELVSAVAQNGDPARYACDLGAPYDLTGTTISATGPIEVIAGHDCAQVPINRIACDHLEESLFPLETWGKTVIAARPRPLNAEKSVLRVVSGADDNTVRFKPEIAKPVNLARGEILELETDQHVLISGSKPLLVAQYLEGQGQGQREGDPSMSFAIPIDQYRARYDFLSPPTYERSYVTIIRPDGASTLLDGQEVTGFAQIEGAGYQVATELLSRSGPHVVESLDGAKLSVVLYGYAPFTSYMLPAGLDLSPINPNPL